MSIIEEPGASQTLGPAYERILWLLRPGVPLTVAELTHPRYRDDRITEARLRILQSHRLVEPVADTGLWKASDR